MAKRYSSDEIQIVRETYPDYAEMLRRMPGRTQKGLATCAQTRGIGVKRKPWTCAEVRKLTALLAQRLSLREIADAFPHRTMRSIVRYKERNDLTILHGLKPVRDPAVQALRERAASLGMSLSELDRRARCPGFYRHGGLPTPCLRHIAAGAAVLGGEVVIEWDPLE